MTKTICARHQKIKGRRLVESDLFTLGLSRPLGKKPAGSGDPPAAVASDVVILDRHPGIILALVVQLAASLHHPREKAPRENKQKTSGFSEVGLFNRGGMTHFW